jgi:Fe-S-cluster containining protein
VANALLKPKLRRDELKPGEVLCSHCTAKCCRYFALPIEDPTTREDWEFIRWYLLHGGATVFKEDGSWYLLVHSECKHLESDNRCGIYHTRPQICREYTTDNCEYEENWTYQQYFETPEQFALICSDLDEVPRDVREHMQFHPVSSVDEVLALALELEPNTLALVA